MQKPIVQQLIEKIENLSARERKALAVLLRQQGVDLFTAAPIFKRDPAEVLLPSYAQERLLFLWNLSPESAAYHIPMALRLRGKLNIEALRSAIAALIERHESLRTTFSQDNTSSIQIIHDTLLIHDTPLIHDTLPLPFETAVLNARADETATAYEARIQAEIEKEIERPFDLLTGPLWRVKLLHLDNEKNDENDYMLILVQHHIISDAWSMRVLVNELIQLYEGFYRGEKISLPPLPIQCADYALWQRAWMESGEREKQLTYWRAQLGTEHPVLELPMDRPRPAQQSYRGARFDFSFAPALGKKLQELARIEGVTLFMLLAASLNALLHRYSGQNTIRIGVPIGNRHRSGTEQLIGCFVNTQILTADINGQMTFGALLKQIKQRVMDAQAHQDLPFEQLVDALRPERNLSYSPLFQVMHNHQSDGPNSSVEQTLQLPELCAEIVTWPGRTAQFDLTFDTHESDAGIFAALTYATDLFDAQTIHRIATHWQNLLTGIVADSTQRIGDLPLFAEDERRLIVSDWNSTRVEYPSGYVHALFEAQAEKMPDAVALIFGESHMTYRELNVRANQLAHRLIECGVMADTLVGIAAQRSLDMVVGLFAILKAGGAYVPLDPDYPADRLAYMFEDSGIDLLLTQSALLDRLPVNAELQTLCLDHADIYSENKNNPTPALHPEHLAYVIYTSGSTGKPKGAGNRHSALVNRLHWMQQAYGLDADDRVLQKTPFSFDVSVWEFFWPLMTGACLVVAAPDEHRDPVQLINSIRRHRITTLHFVPSMLQAFIQYMENGQYLEVEQCRSIKRIVCSGEALPGALQQQVFVKLPQVDLHNLYGPTEAAIDVTHWTCSNDNGVVPIGRPIANVATHILDDELNPLPIGGLGELYLAGAGLARGYHRRPALTAERFVPNTLANNGARLYRTGDRTRYRPQGIIEYLGRIDHQVKIRGLRIELGEIEARLLEHIAVREASVIAQEGPRGQQLVAYVAFETNKTVAEIKANETQEIIESLKDALKAALPDYMVPTHFVVLSQFPLTPNGKLDRKALPRPDIETLQSAFIAPQNSIEQTIADIWQEVLGIERVGRTDNFFELGGDSIISIQVVSRARHAGIRFTPKDLFEHQTVKGLAGVAMSGEETAIEPVAIEQGAVSGRARVTPIQQWFFETAIPQRHHWNQSVLLRSSAPIDAEHLRSALKKLFAHHDGLRAHFYRESDNWYFECLPELADVNDVLWRSELRDVAELEAIADEAQRSLSLAQAPLLRVVLITLPHGEQRLLLLMHHLIVDGVSWRILLDDLQYAYRQSAAGQPVKFPAKTSAYLSWAERLQVYADSGALNAELNYWREQLQNVVDTLPCDRADGSNRSKHAVTINTRLDSTLTRQLLQLAPAAYRTQINDLLLTALVRTICNWTGQSSALIRLEGHGRESLFDDIDLTRTVGWFTSIYPVTLNFCTEIADAIKTVKEQLRAVPNKGAGYGVLRYLASDSLRAKLQTLPQGNITFNYLGQFDQSFDAEKGLFEPATENSGTVRNAEAPLDSLLSINGQIYGGELTLGWTFSSEIFDHATVERLADDYAKELQAIIGHCVKDDSAGITPTDFPLLSLNQKQLDAIPVAPRQIEDVYPLSPMQEGMLFHTLYEREAADYINQIRADVEGLDSERFQHAWQSAVQAHDILRTGFFWQGDFTQPLQVVHKSVNLPFKSHDWCEKLDRRKALADLAESERKQGFDLAKAPLLRITIVRTTETTHHLIFTSHHILMDGWSLSRLLEETLSRYANASTASTNGHYRDYIRWLQSRDAQASELFWKQQLSALAEPVRLAQAVKSASNERQETSRYGDHYQTLSAPQTQLLNEFARAQRVTVNTLVQAAWALLLQRYSGQDSVVFGATVAGRPAELVGIESQLGLFINTLPVIVSPLPEQTVAEWIQRIQRQNIELREYEHTPLYEIQRWAGHGGEALFDNILVFENYPVSAALGQNAKHNLRFSEISNQEQTNYPLTLAIGLNETLTVHYSYGRQHFSDSGITQIAERFERLLCALVKSPSTYLGQLSLLSKSDRHKIIEQGRAIQIDNGTHCIHELIEAQAVATPTATALIFRDKAMSYRELNAQANRLAHRLIEHGAGPDKLIGIATERSLEMVIGLLAILKAGAAYVPLDPDYPEDRLAYMFADSGIRMLLTQSALLERLPLRETIQTWCLDREEIYSANEANPGRALHPENLAYVIYTSGSTGRPKGAGNRHSALTNRLRWMQDAYALNASDRVLQKTPFSFDVSVWEFFWPLMTGACLVVAEPGEHRDADKLITTIRKHRITTLHFVPSMLQVFLQVSNVELCQEIKRIVCSGEALSGALQQQVFAKLPQADLHNLYGPTEAAIDVTHWTCSNDTGAVVPIGVPITNVATYILDDCLGALPTAGLGELFLAGASLARGYHQRPSLTAEKFVPDAFAADGARMYRTGDRARYRADGVIDYAGRIDHQVKIRGLRIELGEIEARLQEEKSVREVVVVAQDGTRGPQLIAYVVPLDITLAKKIASNEAREYSDALKAALKTQLPDYMVPAHIVMLTKLPVTPNGKLDRKALPMPDAGVSRQAHIAPQTATQQAIAAVWKEVLGVERVGLTDNFFELGGHSLLATQVISRLIKVSACSATLRDLFEHPVLQDFAATLASASANVQSHYSQLTARGPKKTAPLSLMQRRLWVAEQLAETAGSYVIPMALRLRGNLSLPQLMNSFSRVIKRHEALRTSYHIDDAGDPIAHIEADIQANFAVLDISELSAADKETRVAAAVLENAQTSIPLDRVPLFHGQIIRLAAAEHVLLFAMHHIISDGWSMGVLIDDLVRLYDEATNFSEDDMQLSQLQYSDFSIWQHELEQNGFLDRQTNYWQSALAGYSGTLALKTDRARATSISYEGGAIHFQLASALTAKLKKFSRETDVTLYTLLLTTFQILMHRVCEQTDVVVGIDVAGRQHAELEQVVGFFVNVLPIRSRTNDADSVADFLAATKVQLLNALENQDLPFDMIVDAVGAPRIKGMNPLVQVLFVMNNLPMRGEAIADITVEPLPQSQIYSKFDMALFINEEFIDDEFIHEEKSGLLEGSWQFATALFQHERIEQLIKDWITILETIADDRDAKVREKFFPKREASAKPDIMKSGTTKAADKLGKFLKRSSASEKKIASAAVRESVLIAGQRLPLVIEPTDASMDIIRWAELNRLRIEKKLLEHAGILFRGFALDGIQGFEEFAETIQPGLYGKYGDLPKKDGGKNTYRSTPYPEEKMILFHNESSHQDRWPRKQMFYCEQPSAVGGATPVVDCRVMYERLPAAIRETFASKGLLYIRTFTDKLDVPWQHFFHTENRAEVETRCTESGIEWEWFGDNDLQIRTRCPAVIRHPMSDEISFFNQVQLHHPYCLDTDTRNDLLSMFGPERMPRNVYYGDGTPISDEVMEIVGNRYEQCAVRFDWKKGDVILLDNMLAAHARDPFRGARKIVVAMGEMIERSALNNFVGYQSAQEPAMQIQEGDV